MNNIPHIVDTGASVQPEEPAGWMGYQDGEFICFLINRKKVKRFIEATDNKGVVVPVYTHPANLTDEEIDIETTRALNDLNGSDYQLIDVAQLIAKYLMQAILRKAQEK